MRLAPRLMVAAVLAGCAAGAAARALPGGGDTVAALAAPNNASTPWFCHDLDCPKYTLVDATDEFDVRAYKEGVWATTQVESYLYPLAVGTGFSRWVGGQRCGAGAG